MGVTREISKGNIEGTLTFPSGRTISFMTSRVELRRHFSRETHVFMDKTDAVLLSEEFLMEEVKFDRIFSLRAKVLANSEKEEDRSVYLPKCRCRVIPHEPVDPNAVKVPKNTVKRVLYVIKRLKKKPVVLVKFKKRAVAKSKGRRLAIKG